jgi:hypothetical protein
MNIYQTTEIENRIELSAALNNGEIDENLLKELVEAQTKSIEQIENLCKYIRHLEMFSENAMQEMARIAALKARANNRIDSIKRYLAPYVKERGKLDAGTFTLSTRQSESVDLDENFDTQNPEYNTQTVSWKPDKKKIKDAFKAGAVIDGVSMVYKNNLQIK